MFPDSEFSLLWRADTGRLPGSFLVKLHPAGVVERFSERGAQGYPAPQHSKLLRGEQPKGSLNDQKNAD